MSSSRDFPGPMQPTPIGALPVALPSRCAAPPQLVWGRDRTPPSPARGLLTVVAAVAVMLLTAAWSLTCAPSAAAAPAAGQPLTASISAQWGQAPSGARPERAMPGGHARHPRRALLPSRQLPLGTGPAGTLVLDVPVTPVRMAPSHDVGASTSQVRAAPSRAPPSRWAPISTGCSTLIEHHQCTHMLEELSCPTIAGASR
jgi:hypothetical protein